MPSILNPPSTSTLINAWPPPGKRPSASDAVGKHAHAGARYLRATHKLPHGEEGWRDVENSSYAPPHSGHDGLLRGRGHENLDRPGPRVEVQRQYSLRNLQRPVAIRRLWQQEVLSGRPGLSRSSDFVVVWPREQTGGRAWANAFSLGRHFFYHRQPSVVPQLPPSPYFTILKWWFFHVY